MEQRSTWVPATFLPEKNPRYALNRRLGGNQRRCECFGEANISTDRLVWHKAHYMMNTSSEIIGIPCTVHLLLFCTMTKKCTQLFHKLSHCYMFRHYRVILREHVINTLPSYPSISNAAVVSTTNIQTVYAASTQTDCMRIVTTKWF